MNEGWGWQYRCVTFSYWLYLGDFNSIGWSDFDRFNICLQVNLDNEAGKAGVALSELAALGEALQSLPRLKIRGLMAIPAPLNTLQQQQNSFQRLAEALSALRQQLPQAPLDTLSMGMSADLEAAIAAGATIVRIGTAIFGRRNS